MSNFHQLEVVGRGSETQLQVGKNFLYLILRNTITVHFIHLNSLEHYSVFRTTVEPNKLSKAISCDIQPIYTCCPQ